MEVSVADLRSKREEDEKNLAYLKSKREEDEKKLFKLQRDAILYRLLSRNNYAGISKETGIIDGWEAASFLGIAPVDIVESLWKECLPLRIKLDKYNTMLFSTAVEREPWLQTHVFIPLLLLLKNSRCNYRLHGNNARLYHSHNKTFSEPDATFTRRDQFALDITGCGPVFELEHTIAEKNIHDKENHFMNGQGQVIMYLAVTALGVVPRPFYLGYLTDCRSLVCYKLDSDLQFHRSLRMDLLNLNAKPTTGFATLVSLFQSSPATISLPEPKTPLSSSAQFQGFPFVVELPRTTGAKKLKATLTFEGVLGFGAASCAFVGNFDGCIGVCIKIENASSGLSVESPRNRSRQLGREIEVLSALKGINGVPTLLWYRQTLSASIFSVVLVTAEVGETLYRLVNLEVIYRELKETLTQVHACRYCHHDVSPTNIILVQDAATQFKPILIDWGLASKFGESSVGFSGNVLFSSVRYDTATSIPYDGSYKYAACDDLESLIYSICYVNHGLPWGHLQIDDACKKNKAQSSASAICRELEFLIEDLQALRDRS